MITYNDLYESLRKERYSETLQPLAKEFVKDVADYLKDRESLIMGEKNLFSDYLTRSQKDIVSAENDFKNEDYYWARIKAYQSLSHRILQ